MSTNEVTFTAGQLKAMLSVAAPAASTRTVLTHVAFSTHDGHVPSLVACDSYRLVVLIPRAVGFNVAVAYARQAAETRMIERSHIEQAIKLAGNKGSVVITWTEQGYTLNAAGIDVSGKWYPAEFPNYQNLIPLASACQPVTVAFDGDKVASLGKMAGQMPCTRYRRKGAHESWDGDAFNWYGGEGPVKPQMFHAAGKSDAWTLLALLMPVKGQMDADTGSTVELEVMLNEVKSA